ncbi:hypothetical protein OROHE_003760 [Orobanche hederae]
MLISAINRRSIGRSGSVGIYASDVCSGYLNRSAKNRSMSTVGVSSSGFPPAPPLLMLPPSLDGRGNISYTFQHLAKSDAIILNNKLCGGGLRSHSDLINDVKFVGSSHGWLALQNRRNNHVFLSNPMTERRVNLPPLSHPVERVVLSSASIEEEGDMSGGGRCLAFKSGLDGRLGFCSPGRTNEWTVFGSNYMYDSLVYSSRHNRLFCVSIEPTILECWDVGGDIEGLPRLDWTIKNYLGTNCPASCTYWPTRKWLKQQCCQLKYVVCAEHSGSLFLVMRHVNLRAGPSGSFADKIVFSMYNGCHHTRDPYTTVDFDVFKVDLLRGELIHMEDSLEGLAIFVGINDPLAIPVTEGDGLVPDSVYFTDENYLVEPTRLERTKGLSLL